MLCCAVPAVPAVPCLLCLPRAAQEIREQFGEDVKLVADGSYDGWRARPYECLAGIILMDQFTR